VDEQYPSHQCLFHARNLHLLTDRLVFAIEADELETTINMAVEFREQNMAS